jgi:amino acid transporter
MINHPGERGLKKVLGFPSLFAAAIGLVVAQACFVSILQGVGHGGATFFIALLIAFLLTLCYAATFAELSLMMPKAGSISTYTLTALGPFPAIIATIIGYVIPNIMLSPAELYLLEEIFRNLFPGFGGYIGFLVILVFAILNILGIDIFSKVQNVLAYSMIVALIIIGLSGLTTSETTGITTVSFLHGLQLTDSNVFSLVVLALFAFMGLEFICPLLEETKNPEKNIPKTFWWSSVFLLVLYSMLALVGMRLLPVEKLLGSSVPHWLLVETLYGKTGSIIMAVLAITATSTSINTVMAAVPRMMYGMAINKQLPPIFMKLHPTYKTPWFSIMVFAVGILVVGGIFRNSKDFVIFLMIVGASTWLLTYIIAHINVMVLRKKYPDFRRPFKTPFYPVPQLLGIAGMVYALIKNAPSPELAEKVNIIFLGLTGTTALYALLWVKFRMKKGLFETESINEVLDE